MANNDDGIRPWVAREIESISSTTDEDQNKSFFLEEFEQSLKETEMACIAEALSRSTHVEKVYLRWCLIGSPVAATSTFIKKILETHPSLVKICLTWIKLSDSSAEVIGLALKTNTSLTELNLACNEIGPCGAEALAKCLCQNKSLRTLHLNANQVGDRGATAFAEALRINKSMEELSLSENGVTMVGAKAMASALEKASLKHLHLTYNSLEDEGGEALAKSLCKNKTLARLSLTCTGIGNGTFKALAAALALNSSLEVLNIKHNHSNIHVGALEDALKHMNYTVEVIDLDSPFHIPDYRDQVHRIDRLCEQNRRLKMYFRRTNQNIPAIPLGAWPRVLEAVECKPDLLYALLKAKPEVCRELQLRNQRRRKHPDWLRY